MKCNDCSEDVLERDGTTFLVLDSYDMIVDHASLLCQKCRIKRHEKLGIKLSL